MNPIAFEVFGVSIGWYGIIISFGILLGVFVANYRAKQENLPEDTIIDLVLWAVPLAVVGTRIYYVAFNWSYYGQNLIEIFKVRQGGLAIHGGIIAGVLVGYFFTKVKKINFWKLADICAPSIILGQAIGRWGNFINKEAYGRPTNLPWAIEINGVNVHPTFLYESLWNLLVFAFLLYYSKRKKYEGQIFLLYIGMYSFARFFIEALRIDSLMFGSFRVAQLVSILTILGAIGTGVYLKKRRS
ncbi:MAG: prolipoprotein diacylglyceryl transferase [Alkaliphilus sp.]